MGDTGFPTDGKDATARLQELASQNRALQDEIAALVSRLEMLEALADTDTLTPLANRRAFLRRVDHAIRQAGRHAVPAILVFVDLDGLKALNDTHGHAAGDAMLCHVATHLTAGLRATDHVARISGDEFGIVLDFAAFADAEARIAKLAEALAATPLLYEGATLPVGFSWGLTAVGPDDSVEDVIARADRAMYATRARQRSET